jgi:hypothetical protein
MVLFYDKQNTNFQALLQLDRLNYQPVKLTLDFKKKKIQFIFSYCLHLIVKVKTSTFYVERFPPNLPHYLSLIEASKLQDFN